MRRLALKLEYFGYVRVYDDISVSLNYTLYGKIARLNMFVKEIYRQLELLYTLQIA